MRFRDAMALWLSRPAGIGPVSLVALALALLWPGVPAQAEADDGTLKISLAGEILSLDARSVPLDRLLAGLAETMGFALTIKCDAAGCPRIRGRLKGPLDEVLGWLLHDHGYSRIYGPVSAADQHPKLRRLVVLTAKPTTTARPEVIASFDSNQDAGFANLMRWAGRGSHNSALTQPGAARIRQAPLSDYRVTSGFGPRRDPLSGHDAWHQGVDLAAPANSKVLSTAPGTVLSAGRRGGYGIIVEVDHGAGVATRYAHLSEALVTRGQRVAGGEPLGVIGASGRVTGQHLHFEVRIKDRPVDPMPFLTPDLTAERRLARLDDEFPPVLP